MIGILGGKYAKSAVSPVDLDCEVVPSKGLEGNRINDIQRMVGDLEVEGVAGGEMCLGRVGKVGTITDLEDVGSVVWFNEHDLVFMLGVQGMEVVFENTEMEDGGSGFHGIPVVLGDDFGSSEAVLGVCWVASRYEDGRVINFHFDGLFGQLGQGKETWKLADPEGGWRWENFVEIDVVA